jgi:hypothetical protein
MACPPVSLKVHNRQCINPAKCTNSSCFDAVWRESLTSISTYNLNIDIPDIMESSFFPDDPHDPHKCCICLCRPFHILLHTGCLYTCVPCYFELLKVERERETDSDKYKTYSYLKKYFSSYMPQKRSERLPSIWLQFDRDENGRLIQFL